MVNTSVTFDLEVIDSYRVILRKLDKNDGRTTQKRLPGGLKMNYKKSRVMLSNQMSGQVIIGDGTLEGVETCTYHGQVAANLPNGIEKQNGL